MTPIDGDAQARALAEAMTRIARELEPERAPGDAPLYFLRETAATDPLLDVAAVRADFPILHAPTDGPPLIWLDNAATTQKPRAVIDAISRYYERANSNVHRGQHRLARASTAAFEAGRAAVARLLGATTPDEVVFLRGATEALNLIAHTLADARLRPGDEVVLTQLEHHANIVPWQMVAERRDLTLRVAPIDDHGQLDLAGLEQLMGPRTRVVAIAHVSNVLGTVLPVRAVADLAHAHGALLVVDGAQAVPHLPVDVEALGCDVYVFSAHKLYGPTGVGALWARAALLDELPPWQGGGAMIEHVTFEQTTFRAAPTRFEAGTPDIAGVVGMTAAIDYLLGLGMARVAAHGRALVRYASRALDAIPGLRRIGDAADRVGPVAFELAGVDCHAVERLLDRHGIALRAGHHCALPTLARFGAACLVRPSMGVYNTTAEIDRLVDALHQVQGELA